MSTVVIVVMVIKYYANSMVFGCAVMYLGYELGIALLSPLIGLLLTSIGWRLTLISFGAALFVMFAMCIALFADPDTFGEYQHIENTGHCIDKHADDNNAPTDVVTTHYDVSHQTEKTSLNSKNSHPNDNTINLIVNDKRLSSGRKYPWWFSLTFVLLLVGYTGFTVAYTTPFIYIPIKAEQYGLSMLQQSLLLGIIGIASVVVRMVALLTGDSHFKVTLWLCAFCQFVSGFVSLWMPYYTDFGSLAAYSVALGIGLGKRIIYYFHPHYTHQIKYFLRPLNTCVVGKV